MRENRENPQELHGLKDAFWLVSEALYEVSKVLNLPADMIAATMGLDGVRSKYSEIKQIKEERQLGDISRAQVSGARDDRETRDRKDRDHQTLTLTALLATNAAYREAHETFVAGVRGDGKRADDGIAKMKATKDANLKVMDEILLSTARLADGRYVMSDGKGGYIDQNLDEVSPEEAATADD